LVAAVFGIFSGETRDKRAAVEFALVSPIFIGGFRVGCWVACELTGFSDPLGWAS